MSQRTVLPNSSLQSDVGSLQHVSLNIDEWLARQLRAVREGQSLDQPEVPSSHEVPIPREIESTDTLIRSSYETLLKQIYNLPIIIPNELNINGLIVPFISFQDAIQKLQRNEIERYIIDPILQSWAGPPGTLNRIITLFGKNGISYLVKARYDSKTNQIHPPV